MRRCANWNRSTPSGGETTLRRWTLVWLAVSVACASTPLRDRDLVTLEHADELVRAGCYDCLIEARDAYAGLAFGRARRLVIQRLFETEILMTLREKELAMDWSGSFEAAETLAPALPPELEASRLLALVEAVPPDSMGWPRHALAQFRRAHASAAGELDGELRWLETSAYAGAVRRYVSIAADCAFPTRRRGENAVRRSSSGSVPEVPEGAAPLVVYRTAICSTTVGERLESILEDDPRFIEANFFLGRLGVSTVQRRGDVSHVREFIEAAIGRFPESPSVAYLSGSFNQLVGDCRTALAHYDRTLDLQPLHENGLLGRTVCLTHLSRTEEAIAAATRMIELELGLDVTSDGFYWRAWNRHHREELPAARADIESAKALRSNHEIHTLAGVIGHDQDDLDPAEDDLRQALRMSAGSPDCTANWYLSLVLMKREQWPETASAFEDAMRCYDRRAREAERGLAEMRASTTVDPDFKAQQIAGFEAAIEEDRGQYHAAAFNAANYHARAGRLDRARPLLEVAARDPKLAELVAELREIIKVHRAPGANAVIVR
jgi:tetratricopeptide (TPR) repeat protein